MPAGWLKRSMRESKAKGNWNEIHSGDCFVRPWCLRLPGPGRPKASSRCSPRFRPYLAMPRPLMLSGRMIRARSLTVLRFRLCARRCRTRPMPATRCRRSRGRRSRLPRPTSRSPIRLGHIRIPTLPDKVNNLMDQVGQTDQAWQGDETKLNDQRTAAFKPSSPCPPDTNVRPVASLQQVAEPIFRSALCACQDQSCQIRVAADPAHGVSVKPEAAHAD